MNTYTITANADGTLFTVVVMGEDGVCKTTLGFDSEAEANSWIASAKRMAKPWSSPRMLGLRTLH